MSQNTMEDSKKGRARRKNPLDPNVDGKRRATIMKRIHMERKRGERIEVTFDEKGQPEGKHGDELMSWIGVLTREHVPIWIQDWRSRDLDGLKEIIWKETVTSFTMDDCFRSTCLKSCGELQGIFDMIFTRHRGSEIRTNNEYSSRGGRDGYRKLDQEKMEYNTQESQGTFESVGTSDVLTQALSRPKHPGRIRGQSKFINSSQYFNLNRSSNRDNEVLSMRREIEELKVLVRGLCANKDVEPSFDQENVPTVDQHNSFKASCSVQEKQHGVSDPPTMPVDSQECKLFIFDEVHGGQLFVTWPKTLVELDTSMNKASRGPSHVPDPAADRKNVKKSMEIKRSTLKLSSMHQGNQIEVPIPYTIMGFDIPVFLSFDDIYEFINLQEINANCILVYMRYLEELCRINGQAEKFVFVSPTLISPVRIDTEDAGMKERANILVSFLRDAPKGQLYLVPHNRGRHWVLGVIDPWEDLVLYF
ncbi:hypothetical protein TIFTF001_016550 [Ficus carica]|uniref:Ubiquitin-like protease family profile domain-containing protein n=1 Tax=Ficus carica TaxID=3494 RepID=A0AA88ATF0_FICCA|nr:hypothetical protein TIFTF001_016550 [Ficus carica]